ncbi:MAG: hypothetical protein MUP21_03410, partial [Dehalococcoidia bacterium]|nr:hypothetical protein [Dehalococcoidia bacterium]
RAMVPVTKRIEEIEQESASAAERLKELEALIADPSHYKDSKNVVAVNREYLALRERVVDLTAKWDGLTTEAERLKLDFLRAKEAL